ncbi:lipoyl(octanoyl) transferase LipB [Nitrosomonas oligotropha]|uniref:Octanoyltransferase n=1 Tax=Nitrosomonas oligotropha TaxID=42354 RepID=A0A1H8K8G6_9PROT|nr:lipoyl(octanoyl) transferase LipB [Nitrosomonas oligotropha]SDW28374.1 lipoyl(octanoyl) transferase [Nitrosomonas oligotropha]SEN89007.1 lipoyl(octanoyl) transferase [Nitrosomonas oligotropha]
MQNLSTPVCTPQHFIVRTLGLSDYQATWQAMKDFTDSRNEQTRDEIWLLQHPPVFTQGIAGKPEHLLHDHGIAVVKTDRGGQITYHGPGQIIAYLLLDIRRLKLGVRELVRLMESAVIGLLQDYRINAAGRVEAPGVYVGNAKIASLGLKIRKNFCYHGIALNVDMDLTPFSYINPCGYQGLQVTQTKNLGIPDGTDILSTKLADQLQEKLLTKRLTEQHDH